MGEDGDRAIARLLAARIGHAFPGGRASSLAAAVSKTARRTGIAVDELPHRLAGEPALLEELLAEVLVGETYFFRQPEQLAFLRDRIFPELLSRAGARRLRLWSAGCATGEEPYTLAMLAHESGIAAQVEVLGTDLSRRSLAVARGGRYRRWSLRATSVERERRFFVARGDELEVVAAVRARVRLRALNLAEPCYPSAATGVEAMDVVLCRNVLIYFEPAVAAEVTARLVAALAPGGWLLLGASDPFLVGGLRGEVISGSAGLAFRVPLEGESIAASRSTATPARDQEVAPDRGCTSTPPRPARTRRDRTASAPGAARSSPAGAHALDEPRRLHRAHSAPRTAAERCAEVRALADRGELREAMGACAGALEDFPTSAELAYLEAVLLLDFDHDEAAARAARRALYLDDTLAVAHLALGAALTRLGNVAAARRSYQNARELLARAAPEIAMPAAGGETAARLRVLADTHLALLARQP